MVVYLVSVNVVDHKTFTNIANKGGCDKTMH